LPPLALKEIVDPTQNGPVLEAVAVGVLLTVTVVVAMDEQPFWVTVTVYTPDIEDVEPVIVGF
jgi:hypothetical protein